MMDSLNTHKLSTLYEAFAPVGASPGDSRCTTPRDTAVGRTWRTWGSTFWRGNAPAGGDRTGTRCDARSPPGSGGETGQLAVQSR